MVVNFDKYEDLSKFKGMLLFDKYMMVIDTNKYNL